MTRFEILQKLMETIQFVRISVRGESASTIEITPKSSVRSLCGDELRELEFLAILDALCPIEFSLETLETLDEFASWSLDELSTYLHCNSWDIDK